jgi:hypothetical protein
MSRFETSKFIRDNSKMNQDCLIDACIELNWKYNINGNELTIYDLGGNKSLGNEYAIKVTGNDVTYNTYYLGNAKSFVNELQSKYNTLNVEYSKKIILNEFKKKGFTYKSTDDFNANDEEKLCFYMVGRSKNKLETEPIGQIKFTILFDGTVISDSNYLPEDVNKLAHEAMDNVDYNFSSTRIMTKKEIPSKYKDQINRSKLNQVQNIKKN